MTSIIWSGGNNASISRVMSVSHEKVCLANSTLQEAVFSHIEMGRISLQVRGVFIGIQLQKGNQIDWIIPMDGR